MTLEKVSDLSQIQKHVNNEFIFYGDDTYNSFYIAMENDTPLLGLVYYDFGIKPCVLENMEKKFAYIGFGRKILIFNRRKNKICEKKVTSIFFEILVANDNYIFICETDIYVFQGDREIFSMNFEDIICDVTIANSNSLRVSFDSGNVIVVPLVSSDS